VLITLVGLVLVVLAAVFVAWPLLAGTPTAEVGESPLVEASELEKEKDSALLAIRDADFDHSVGKLSDDDHAALRAELEQRALRAITALDAASGAEAAGREPGAEPGLRAVRGHGSGTPEAAGGGFCPSCGHRFGRAASFCAGCGKKLPSGGRPTGRRRATS
jgi:hypothetical protein